MEKGPVFTVTSFYLFKFNVIICISKASIKLFKLKHLPMKTKPTSTLDASYAPAMQIKPDNSTLSDASAPVLLFTFTVSALQDLIRQTQTHTTAVHSGNGPSFLLAVPPQVLRRETEHLCGWKNLHV